MLIAIAVYVLAELLNIIYTSCFGFANRMDQPFSYVRVRGFSKLVRYGLGVVILLLSANSNLMIGALFLIAPFVIDKLIFQYCKGRETRRLAAVLMSGGDPMSREVANETAKSMVDGRAKNKTLDF